MNNPKHIRRQRRRASMNLAVIVNGREIPRAEREVLLLDVSHRFRERREQVRQLRVQARIEPPAERSSIRRLTDAVERRLVDALWTLACLPSGGAAGRCGLAYIHDRAELFANAVAHGDWGRNRPAAPPSRSIDAMHEPLSWLEWPPRDVAEIVRSAANSKQGQAETNVAWGRVRTEVPSARGLTVRTLQRRYDAGLRAIATRLALGPINVC